jgi:type IX secretion system PorP/SprF family membrane protein
MTLKNKSIIITGMLFFLLISLNGQQLPLYSQYMMNGFLFNPAVAGSDGYTTFSVSSRDDMVGFENSPRTNAFSVQGRILRSGSKVRQNSLFKTKSLSKRSGRIGVGAYVFNDRNGYVQRVGGQIAYAYHIYMQNTQLSFGLSASTFQFKLDNSKLNFQEPDDVFDKSFANKVLVPDVSAGVYLLTANSYYGFSVANCFETRVKIGGSPLDYRMYRHYFLMGGKRFNMQDLFSWEPSFLIKGTEKMGFQADIQFRTYYNKDYYMGLCYRTSSAIGIMVGAKLNRLFFSYAFDYSLQSIRRYSYGAHEINLAYKLGDSARRYKWLIRY